MNHVARPRGTEGFRRLCRFSVPAHTERGSVIPHEQSEREPFPELDKIIVIRFIKRFQLALQANRAPSTKFDSDSGPRCFAAAPKECTPCVYFLT